MTALSFTVIGTPAAQGSKRGQVRGGKVILIEQSTKVRPWRAAVADAARIAMYHNDHDGFPTGPLYIRIVFWVKRPKSEPKTRYTWPDRQPDLDKYVRATLDGLTEAGVWHDDGQVCELIATKRYVDPGHAATGAEIVIDRIPPDELAASMARHPSGKARP